MSLKETSFKEVSEEKEIRTKIEKENYTIYELLNGEDSERKDKEKLFLFPITTNVVRNSSESETDTTIRAILYSKEKGILNLGNYEFTHTKPIENEEDKNTIKKNIEEDLKKNENLKFFKLPKREIFHRLFCSLLCILCFIGVAMAGIILGITIEDLAVVTNVSTSDIGWAYIIKSVGMIFSGASLGFFIDFNDKKLKNTKLHLDQLRILFISILILILSFVLLTIPILQNFYFSLLFQFFVGFGIQGSLIVVQNMINSLFFHFKKMQSIVSNTLHFSYGLSMAIFPLIVSFVYQLDLDSKSNILIIHMIPVVFMVTWIPLLLVIKTPPKLPKFMELRNQISKELNSASDSKKENIPNKESLQSEITGINTNKETNTKIKEFMKNLLKKAKGIDLLRVILNFFLFSSVTFQLAAGNCVTVVSFRYGTYLGLTKQQASYLSSLIYVGFSLGRFVAIFLGILIPPFFFMLTLYVLGMISLSIYLIFAGHLWTLWIIAPIFSFLAAPVVGTYFLYLKRTFGINVTAFETSLIYNGTSLGQLFNYLTNYFLDIWVNSVPVSAISYFSLNFSSFLGVTIVGYLFRCRNKEKEKKILRKQKNSLLHTIDELEEEERELEERELESIDSKAALSIPSIESCEFHRIDTSTADL